MIGRIAAAVLAGVVGLGATGCGGDDSTGPSPASAPSGDPADLTVVAQDITFPQDSYQAEAGTVDVAYRNEGRIKHTLLVEGVESFELEVRSEGDVDTGTVELEPGRYILYCDLPGHRQAGMEATLEVS